MLVVTGAAGFIGSALVSALNAAGETDILAVDEFSRPEKQANLKGKNLRGQVDRERFLQELPQMEVPRAIFHIGARTDTAEFDYKLLAKLNVNYSKTLWDYCAKHQIPFIYASSAATYGGGEHGYADDESQIDKLQPLNPYGESKQEFDIWALAQEHKPSFWAGLKFFNVYGPNEYHKGRMASVIFHAFNQIQETGGMKLFRSHNPKYKDGEQLRDFVYVKDVLRVIQFLWEKQPQSGIYNLGTGQARTFLDLTRATFKAMGKTENISFRDTPEDIRDKYQYYTQAEMQKLKDAGYEGGFTPLEEGVEDYVKNYLLPGNLYF